MLDRLHDLGVTHVMAEIAERRDLFGLLDCFRRQVSDRLSLTRTHADERELVRDTDYEIALGAELLQRLFVPWELLKALADVTYVT